MVSASPLINTFSHHYRHKYGEVVGKIPIDLGLVCPNRQLGGCIFCRPASFTPGYLNRTDDVLVQIAKGKTHLLGKRFTKFFAYFQQETCTALPVSEFLPLLEQILTDENCIGLILSTRPDAVPDELLMRLKTLLATTGKECLFELGLQTIHEESLRLLNRNHGFDHVVDAIERIKMAGPFEVGCHLIFGIPGESEDDMLTSLTTVCQMNIDALKLHHLQVICDTPLHTLYQQGTVELFSHQQYLEFLLRAMPQIPAHIVIHRLWATSHPDLLIAPKWHILAGQLSQELQQKMRLQGISQGQASAGA